MSSLLLFFGFFILLFIFESENEAGENDEERGDDVSFGHRQTKIKIVYNIRVNSARC